MKTANTLDGKKVEASASASKEAICPDCGDVLTLRSRRTMKRGKATYFWRHRGNSNPDCSARNRPID